jgi:competence protein ComEA
VIAACYIALFSLMEPLPPGPVTVTHVLGIGAPAARVIDARLGDELDAHLVCECPEGFRNEWTLPKEAMERVHIVDIEGGTGTQVGSDAMVRQTDARMATVRLRVVKPGVLDFSGATVETVRRPVVTAPVTARATVSVNAGTAEQLSTVPGIGVSLAWGIILSRPHATVDDIMRVRGIGPVTLELMRPYLNADWPAHWGEAP